VKALLKGNADLVSSKDSRDDTPLIIAAKFGHEDIAAFLLANKANVNAMGKDETFSGSGFAGIPLGGMPLGWAVRDGNIDSATRLLSADAQLVNTTNRSGQTPLRLAATLRKTNMVDFLEQRGAQWDAASAAMAGRADILRTILQQKPAAVSSTANGKGLLHIAAANGDSESVNLLLAAKCEPLAADLWGLSPLGYALINKKTNIAQLLIASGANENLFDAVYLGDLKTVSQLLAHDKSLANSRNSAKVSAVEVAAATGQAEILRLLLKHGGAASPSDSPKKGIPIDAGNPLHLAAFHNQTNTMKLLINAGAHVNEADTRGLTPLHWAVINGAPEAATLSLKCKADLNSAVAETATSRSIPFGHGPPGPQSLRLRLLASRRHSACCSRSLPHPSP